MSNYAWLCDYTDFSVADTYNIIIQTKKFDGCKYFYLEEKKKCSHLDPKELIDFDIFYKAEDEFFNSWKNYQFITNDDMPISLFKRLDINEYRFPKQTEFLFRIVNNYLVIHKKLYDVISQFNLGKTHFSQVYIYDIETKEQLSDVPYYFVNIAEKFEFLDVENSQGIKANFYQPEHPVRSIWAPEDDDIKLSLNTKDFNLDLWHDPKLRHSLFFSDRLVQALFKSGFNQKELGLIRCIIN